MFEARKLQLTKAFDRIALDACISICVLLLSRSECLSHDSLLGYSRLPFIHLSVVHLFPLSAHMKDLFEPFLPRVLPRFRTHRFRICCQLFFGFILYHLLLMFFADATALGVGS